MYLDHLSLKFPIFGNILYKSIIARYSRTLSTIFSAGVPLVDALESTAYATNHLVYEHTILYIRDQVASGHSLQKAMQDSQRFPTMAVQMVAIGEESGELDAMLEHIAQYYENDVDDSVNNLTSLLEPIVMLVLAVIVGALVIAMYFPIFKMGDVL